MLAVAVVLSSAWLAGPFDKPAAASTAGQSLNVSQLAADLVMGARTLQAPRNLTPQLSLAGRARPFLAWDGCHLPRSGLKSKPCVFGDTTSRTTVVLFGDSHALAWFPAMDLISEQQHWRLVDLTKDGCPPAEVNIAAWFRAGAPYWECARWRANAMAQIAALRPALVIVTAARWREEPEARPMPGVPTTYGNAWQDGWAAIFRFLRSVATHVLFISDVPTLTQSAPSCVAAHVSDVQVCTSPLSAAIALPAAKDQEIQLARDERVDWIDPTSWFCTPVTCPVIVRSILLYRDSNHMTPAWSTFIAPVLADSILPIMHVSPTPATQPSR
jgi:hypothetical protein